jgi:hypothetical protein
VTEEDMQALGATFVDPVTFSQMASERSVATF